MSYVLTSLMLLSQLGLPLHMHYCKGMLESVSVYFTAECNDHDEIADLPACCQKTSNGTCAKDDACCDDEVKVLLQEFDSLLPHFDKLINVGSLTDYVTIPSSMQEEISSADLISTHSDDSGPPIYILFGSLIFYA